MAAHKHFKQLIRARMASTGEPYSVARKALRDAYVAVALEDCVTVDVHGRHGQAVLFTPDGNTLLSAGQDALVHLLDPVSGALLGTLAGHERVVNDLSLTPDGRTLVSASSDRTVRTWSLATRTGRHVLDGHPDAVVAVDVAPDGRTVITGGYDGRLRRWDLDSGERVSESRSPLERLGAVLHTPDGRRTVESGQGPAVVVRDATTGEVVAQLDTGAPGVVGLAAAPDGSMIVTGGHHGVVSLWDAATWEEIRRTDVANQVSAVTISRNGQLLATAASGQVALWSFESDAAVATAALPIKGVRRGVLTRRQAPCTDRRRRPRPYLAPALDRGQAASCRARRAATNERTPSAT